MLTSFDGALANGPWETLTKIPSRILEWTNAIFRIQVLGVLPKDEIRHLNDASEAPRSSPLSESYCVLLAGFGSTGVLPMSRPCCFPDSDR